MINRRLFLITAVLLLACPLFSQQQTEQLLRFASSNTHPERKAEIRYLCDAFELYNPGVRVEIVDFNDDSFEDLIADGKPVVDLLIADSPIIGSLAKRKLLKTDLTAEIIEQLGRGSFYGGALDAFNSGDAAAGIPYTAWLQLIWYRSDFFESAGLKPPKTPAQLLSGLKLITASDITDYGIITGTAADRYLLQCFYQISGGTATGQAAFGKPSIRSIELYRSIASTAPSTSVEGGLTWRARDFYFQGKAAALIYSSHLMDDLAIETIAQDSLTADNFPELEGRRSSGDLFKNTAMIGALNYGGNSESFGSISGWGIFRTDADDDVVSRFIRFFFRNDVYISYMHMSPGGMLPVRPGILEYSDFYRDPGGIFVRYGRERLIDLCRSIEHLSVLPSYSNYGPPELHADLWP